MKFFLLYLSVYFIVTGCDRRRSSADESLNAMRLANQYFMNKWPDPGQDIVVDEAWPKTQHKYPVGKKWPSSIWTRAVYYDGLMAFYSIDSQKKYYDYAIKWGEKHNWHLNDKPTWHADNHCAGKIFVELYQKDNKNQYIENTKYIIDSLIIADRINRWTWIDAIYMAMPVYARLGNIYKKNSYWERMYEMYHHTKYIEGGNGLYNPEDGLWWRDKKFLPPYTEPNEEDCYWSRGNGWVIAALCQVLEAIPENEPHRKEYVEDLKAMANALIKVQREDGFWNVSLHDANNFGGKETTGTSLFIYGIAWGINNNILNERAFRPKITKAWNAILSDALHPNGFLGYVQGTGHEPASSQPVGYDIRPDFEDFGLGCFLLAGTEIYKMLQK